LREDEHFAHEEPEEEAEESETDLPPAKGPESQAEDEHAEAVPPTSPAGFAVRVDLRPFEPRDEDFVSMQDFQAK